jgi:hypothetical protein
MVLPELGVVLQRSRWFEEVVRLRRPHPGLSEVLLRLRNHVFQTDQVLACCGPRPFERQIDGYVRPAPVIGETKQLRVGHKTAGLGW